MNDDDDADFSSLIPGVRRLQSDRVNVYAQRQTARPGRRAAPDTAEIAADDISESAPRREAHFSPGLQKKLQRRIRQGQIRPEASLDLHGCRRHEALQMLASFVDESLRRGLRMIVIIHGQGYRSQQDAVLKPLVQQWLGNHPRVLAWCPAQARDGAAGASYVYLQTSQLSGPSIA